MSTDYDARTEERAERAREARLRRKAHRLGLAVVKLRARSLYDPTIGSYGLVDPYSNMWVTYEVCGHAYGYSLDWIEEFLDNYAEEMQRGREAAR